MNIGLKSMDTSCSSMYFMMNFSIKKFPKYVISHKFFILKINVTIILNFCIKSISTIYVKFYY